MKKLLLLFVLFGSLGFVAFAATEKSFLDSSEEASISSYLWDIGMDTYCGGDHDYPDVAVTCDDKVCTVKISITSWYLDDEVSAEKYNNAADENKSGSSDLINWKFTGVEGYTKDDEDDDGNDIVVSKTKIWASCELLGLPYDKRDLSTDDKQELVYDALLDCVDVITSGYTSL